MALFLEHQAEGLPELKHSGAPQLFYRWHGSDWSRYPLPVTTVPAGAVLTQKNAYLSIPFSRTEGVAQIETLRNRLVHPLVLSGGKGIKPDAVAVVTPPRVKENSTNRLARRGEAGDCTPSKQILWNALRDCKDAQLYTADIDVVDLGLVYDLRVRGPVVTVIMAMPHRGRPLLGYFIDGSISVHPTLSLPVRERLLKIPGVKQVVVEQTWSPGWSSNRLSNEGRKKLGLDEAN